MDRNAPVAVPFLQSGVQTLAVGEGYTCANGINSTQCWGSNQWCQLGLPSSGTGPFEDCGATRASTPALTRPSIFGAMLIDGGLKHSCGVVAGSVLCWGDNQYGRVGQSDTRQTYFPMTVPGLGSGMKDVATGKNHSCAVSDAGAVTCWGRNDKGQLGDGGTTDRSNPALVLGLNTGFVAVVAAEDTTCAQRADGALFCWGDNELGEVGDGTTTQRRTPVFVMNAAVAKEAPLFANGFEG